MTISCNFLQEEFGKAEKNLRAALKMDKKLYGDRDDQVAHDLNGLGLLLDNQVSLLLAMLRTRSPYSIGPIRGSRKAIQRGLEHTKGAP